MFYDNFGWNFFGAFFEVVKMRSGFLYFADFFSRESRIFSKRGGGAKSCPPVGAIFLRALPRFFLKIYISFTRDLMAAVCFAAIPRGGFLFVSKKGNKKTPIYFPRGTSPRGGDWGLVGSSFSGVRINKKKKPFFLFIFIV